MKQVTLWFFVLSLTLSACTPTNKRLDQNTSGLQLNQTEILAKSARALCASNCSSKPLPQISGKTDSKMTTSRPAPESDCNRSSRILLVVPLPLPEINYLDHNQQAKKQPSGRGRRILINLFSRQSPHCAAELRAFQSEAPELKRAGINLLALEVNHRSSPDSNESRKNEVLPENFAFPFRYGFASPTLIADLERIHNLAAPLEYPLPIPSSFLLDPQGRVTVIYKGPVNPQQLARDAGRESDDFSENLVQAMPFTGRFCKDPQLLQSLKENFALKLLQGGRQLEDLGRTDEALFYYYEALKILPDAALPNYRLAEAHYRLRHLNATVTNLKEALQKDPDLTPARKLLARIHLTLGETQLGALQLLAILHKDPQDAETLANLGVAYITLGRPEMGRKKLEEALNIDPKNAQTNFNLGALNLREGHLAEAEKNFTKTLLLQADYPDINYHLGILAERRKKPEKAVIFYQQELKNNPTHLKAGLRLAEIHEEQGKRPEAKSSTQP